MISQTIHLRSGKPRGFTLIELFIVMMIIAMMAVIITPKFHGGTYRSRVKATEQSVSNLQSKLDAFMKKNGRYPTTDEGLSAVVAKSDSDALRIDAWGNKYIYRCPGVNGSNYDLFSTGPSGIEGNGDNIAP